MVLRSILAFLAVVVSIVGNAQTLTISASGQNTPGTNWSFSGTTITVTGTADIAASYIQDKLGAGALSIVGNTTDFSVYADQAIASSASNTLNIGASGNTGTVSFRSTVALGGSLTINAGEVSFLESLTLTGSGSLSVTSLNTVVNATATIAGSANIASSGNFILGTNLTAGTGYPFTASGGFTKTGAGTSYLFSDIITTNSVVSIAGPVVIGSFNNPSTTTEIKSNGGNISMSGAVSAYTGTGRDYIVLLYTSLFDADGGMVTGSTTEMYLRFNAGSHLFNGLPGMPSTISMQYLVAAGGGGGGNSSSGAYSGGGGGGGGVADGTYTYSGTAFNIVVGAGGSTNTNGSDSYLATIKSGGGGAGGNWNASVGLTGNGGAGYAAGGGGGGHGSNVNTTASSGGSGTQRSGGSGANCCSLTNYGGSGGGATGNASGYNSGGAGYSSSITGAAVTYGSGAECQGTPVAKTGGGGGALHYGTVQGANGTIIIRFTLPNASTLNAQTPTSLVHLNAGAGGIALGSTLSNLSSLTVTSDGATSIAGLITGSGSFTKAGSSTLTLSGNHTYSGGTIVNGGILALNDIYNNGQGVIKGELTVNQNGTVQLIGLASALGHHLTQRVTKININGGLIDANSGQQHIWNLDGGLTFNGGGTLRSNGGTSNAAATSYIEWGVGNVTVTNPTAPAIIAGRINLRSDLTGGAITFNVSDGAAENDLLISAAITQTSAPTIAKTGAGKITFTGANTHTSVTTISAGVLQVGAAGTTGSISGGSVVNNATLLFNRSNDYTISNVISGSGTIEKLGAGVLTLSGANTYTGATTITAGTLKLGSTTALGAIAGATVVSSGAALDLNGQAYASAEPLTISGTGLSSGGALFNASATAASFPALITLAAASLVKCTSGNITLSGTINGAFNLDIQSTTANYTQSGIIGATAAPTAYTINTGSGQTTISANTTVAGPVTIDAAQISMNSTIASSLSNAALTFRSQKFINHTGTTGLTLNTNGGNILLAANTDDATDSDVTVNGYILFSYGLTINSGGGNITLGGGDVTASAYALGTSAYPYEGLRIDGTVNISSGGGNIIMRGKSYAVSTSSAAWGLGFWNLSTGTINSGVGTILLDGFSQSTSSGYSAGLFANGVLTITSANTTADAIKLIAKGTGLNTDAWGMEFESALNVYATALGGGITFSSSQQVADNYDVVFRGVTNILAKSGPIQLLGKQSSGVGNGRFFFESDDEFYLGSKAGSPVTTSSSAITIQYDKFSFPSGKAYMATTGNVTIQPASTSFGQEFYTSWFSYNQNSQTMASLVIGKANSTANITHQTTAITAAGPVTFYGGDLTLSHNVTSTLTGADVLFEASGFINLGSSRVIQTASGDITFKACAAGAASGASSPIYLNSSSQLLSTGGNITLGGAYAGVEGNLYCASNITNGGYALRLDAGSIVNAGGGNIALYGKNLTHYGDGVYLSSVNISTIGNGTIKIYGESYGGFASSTNFGGITFDNNASTIQTVNGQLILKALLTNTASSATSALNFYRNGGSPNQVNHIQLLSETGDIQITADRGTTSGGGIDHWSWGHVYIGSPSNNSYTATGDITLTYAKLINAANNGFKVKTTGAVVYQPVGDSFDAAQTLPANTFYVLADGAASLTIGKPNNTANLTMDAATTAVAGNLTIYGGTLTLNGNLTTTNNGNISLYSDNALAGLSSTRTITAAGTLTYAPRGTSFAAAVTYPITNLSVSSKGLTIGKVGNDKNITVGAATTIDGPITLYGAAIAMSNPITSSNATTGNISLNGTTLTGAAAITLPTGRTLTFNLSANTDYTGTITTAGRNFVKDGAGILSLPSPTALSFADLTLSGGAFKVNGNQQLTLTGVLTNNATFTLESGATFVQGTSVTGTGTYNIKQTINNGAGSGSTLTGRYWYLGSPLQCARSTAFGSAGSLNKVWAYTNPSGYTAVNDADILQPTAGYVHRRSDASTILTFSGQNLYAQDQTLTLGNTVGTYTGWHLKSNPYTAFLDWHDVLAASTNIASTYYIRSYNTTAQDANALISYNQSTELAVDNTALALSNAQARYFAPLQAFWVKVNTPAGTGGTLALARSYTSHETGNVGLKSSTIFPTLARVNLVDGARFDQMLVFMNQDMVNGVDEYDSEKMFVSGAPQLYTMAAGKKLVMNGLNSNKKKISVPVYLELPESKVYQLQLADYNLEDGLILLEDKQEGTIQDFTIHDTYAFYANSGVLQNRFVLHFYMPDATITAQGPSNIWVAEEGSYTEGGNIVISSDPKGKVTVALELPEDQKVEGMVQVTDANGRTVYINQLQEKLTIFELNLPTGIYYLTVQSGNIIETKKVFIQD